MLDSPFQLTAGETKGDIVLTLSNTAATIAGRFEDADGRPAADCFVNRFPSDRRCWLAGARRIRAVRPDSAGHFAFTPLPSGDYQLAAVWDVEPDEWFDPAFLETLLPAAIPTLAEGERRTQDIRIAGG